jgi:SAM-dependent methyltransferase
MYEDDLAYIHQQGFNNLLDQASPVMISALQSAGFRTGTVIDLGCGGGALLKQLTDAGYQAIGVDCSPAFTAMAQRTSSQATVHTASFYDYDFVPSVAVFALGEVLAYLPSNDDQPGDLSPVAKKINDALQPGGVFIFDIILRNNDALMNYQSHRLGKDWAVFVSASESTEYSVITRHITTFRQIGTHYRRGEEIHRQQVFDAGYLGSVLEHTGFQVSMSDHYGNYALLPRRRAFFARKP